jgi:phytoene dehydrogenase-like protein
MGMAMSESFDALVIGAGPSGLIAAAYLARGGARVCALEAAATPGGACSETLILGGHGVPRGAHLIHALDPHVVKDLRLKRRGLAFAARDLTPVLLNSDGPPLILGRTAREAANALAALSSQDAATFPRFRTAFYGLARAMRPLWWDEARRFNFRRQLPPRGLALARLSAQALLDGAFASETLKAAFAFDAMAGGQSPAEAGSALTLLWRTAQAMDGRQNAAAIPKGGFAALIAALVGAAQSAGAKIRTQATVTRLILSGEEIAGVQLSTGEEIKAKAVLSCLSRQKTLLELAPAGAAGFAESARLLRRAPLVCDAKLVLLLGALPAFAAKPGRYLFADRLGAAILGHADARAGHLPDEPAIEAVVPSQFDASLAPAGNHILSLIIRPLPVAPSGGWPRLSEGLIWNVLAMLERHAPGLKSHILDVNLAAPMLGDGEICDADRLLAPAQSRIATPVAGLYLCGNAAEPVPSLSGRAARLAARTALAQLKETAR